MKTSFLRLVNWIFILAMLLPAGAPPDVLGSAPEWQRATNGYAISGRVTDGQGDPVQGVTISAYPLAESVQVKDEVGKPVNGAQVFRNGILEGITDSNGILTIPFLAIGDKLIARSRIIEVATSKNNHSQDSTQNWAYRVYITSLDIPKDTDPIPYTIKDLFSTPVLVVKKSNTLIGFNILATVEWDANSTYLNELQQGFKAASEYLYDASDGQMVFERVTIVDNNQWVSDTDYYIQANNSFRPGTAPPVGQLVEANASHTYFGRGFGPGPRYGPYFGSYNAIDGLRAFIHEFGHYGLGLYDSYLDKNGEEKGNCVSAAIRENLTDNINATLMCYSKNASEFSLKDVLPLWSSECENTQQWVKTGKSDWQAIHDFSLYKDAISPERWTIKTPADYHGVVAGPVSIPEVKIWTSVNIGADASTGVCEPPVTYSIKYPWGAPGKGAITVLRHGGREIEQGKSDNNGDITILGAANGDWFIANLLGIDLLINSIQVSCSNGLTKSMNDKNNSNEIVLLPAAFDVIISTQPGTANGQLMIIVKTPASLPTAPETTLSQLGASRVTVMLAYDSGLLAYTGSVTLDSNLPYSGVIVTKATNEEAQTVEVTSAFNLETIQQNQDMTIWSSDGLAKLYLPTGTLSANGQVSFNYAQSLVQIPDGKVLLSGPYSISISQGVNLQGNVVLSLYYLDFSGSLMHANLGSAQIYQEVSGSWMPVASTSNQIEQVVFGSISSFGTYAVFANIEEKIFLPMVMRNSQALSTQMVLNETNQTQSPVESANLTFSKENPLMLDIIRSMAVYTAITDADGYYTISNLPIGNYLVIPSKNGYNFNPPFQQIILPPDAAAIDFTCTNCSISICDRAEFIEHVSYPDDSEVVIGHPFVKTWRLKNVGTCTWTSDYSLVFSRGDAMSGPASAQLTPGTVAPGELLDISVVLLAPSTPGTYQGFWLLRNSYGVRFGVGDEALDEFWVKINAIE